jgi:uncharacterized protein YbjT (DUF2867 family)
MILVTGATGHLGSAIINYLLKKLSASQIAALVRDVSKAAGLKEKGVTYESVITRMLHRSTKRCRESKKFC